MPHCEQLKKEMVPSQKEKVLAWFCLFVYTGALSPFFLDNSLHQKSKDSIIQQLLFLCTYLIAGAFFLQQPKVYLRKLFANHFLLAFLLLSFLSALWSHSPGLTLRKSIALSGTSIFSIYFASRFSIHRALSIIVSCYWVIIIVSILAAALAPSIAFHSQYDAFSQDLAGAFRGIFIHKNQLGIHMVFSCLISYCLYFSAKIRKERLIYLASLIVSFLMVILSSSKNSLVTVVSLFLFVPFINMLKKTSEAYRKYLILLFLLLIICVVTGCIYYYEDILDALGRDITFSGRLPLWILVLIAIGERPILGYGYEAFWGSGWSGPAGDVWRILTWEPPNAHNGLLDLALSIGCLSLLVFLSWYVVSTYRAFRGLSTRKDVFGIWPILFMAFFLLINLAESNLVKANSILWVMFIFTHDWINRNMLGDPVRTACKTTVGESKYTGKVKL